MQPEIILPINIALSTLSIWLITQWYLMPKLKSIGISNALTILLLPNTFRHIGLSFFILGVTAQPLDPRFTNPAAYGDLLTAVLAFITIFALRKKWLQAIPLVWLTNVIGILDLVDALIRGLIYEQNGHLGAAYYIPAVIVPALLVIHVQIFRLLLSAKSTVKYIPIHEIASKK